MASEISAGDDSFVPQEPMSMPQGNTPLPQETAPMPNTPTPEEPTTASEEKQGEEGGKEGIQQMAGQLSQMIRDYNAEQPQPDAETNKFAAGMVVAAAIKDLDEKDRKDILKKLKAGDYDSAEPSEEPAEDVPAGPMPEGVCYTKKQIKEGVY